MQSFLVTLIFKSMKKNYCPHCWPSKRKYHCIFHIEYYVSGFGRCLDKIVTTFLKPIHFLTRKGNFQEDVFWMFFLELLSLIKIVQFIDKPDESKIYNRSLIFFKEAKRRNIPIQAIKVFGKYVNHFRFIYNKRKYYYEGIPVTMFQTEEFEMDNKDKCKRLLNNNNLPIANGKMFTNLKGAMEYGLTLGFPLVVKPYNASLSHHVTCRIKSQKSLLEAIMLAKQYCPAFIVERYIEGKLYRASVVGKKYIFICQKDRANIVGDGNNTIGKLIENKNDHIYRGDKDQMNFTLHKIPFDNILESRLKAEGYTLNTVLPENKKLYLQDKYILTCGCDIINCKEHCHADNRDLFFKTARILGSDLVGIDFICQNIGESHKLQQAAILEVNSLPYIDMHQYPSHGSPEAVSAVVWDFVLSKI